eukprot:TRINITY_DN9370_c0_g1_i3.p1 TRINITY_DN9370_c0_g1~~TRINITY_DN9370_c0_g1_i3.p1  ORF type:complete len:237 (-),score=29.13 TRINITY_DN9370_c0_g1_i3:4-714(-)
MNILPVLMLHTNCLAWTVYGFVLNSYAVLPINCIGIVITLLYIIIYYSVASQKTRSRIEIALVSIHLVLFIYTALAVYLIPPASHHLVLGIVANVISLLFFAAPLSTMSKIIKTRNTASLSFPLAVTSLVGALFWMTFGLGVQDPFIWAPNFMGSVLSLCQLAVYGFFTIANKASYVPQSDDDKLADHHEGGGHHNLKEDVEIEMKREASSSLSSERIHLRVDNDDNDNDHERNKE